MSKPKNLTKAKAQQALKAVEQQFAVYIEAGYDGPKLYEPGHQCSGWAIGWEEGPYEWPYRAFEGGTDEELFELAQAEVGAEGAAKLANDPGAACPEGVFAEPVNHWCLGLYPA